MIQTLCAWMFTTRILFWTDSSPKIERLDLANNSRQVVVTSTYLQRPTTLVIDFVTQQLLWLDSAASRIGFVNFDGSGLSFWSMQLFSSISSFVIFKGYFFLSDQNQPKGYAYNYTEKTFVGYVTADFTSGIIDITAFAPERQPSFTSPCSLDNGGCNHFCITKSSTEIVCQCSVGFILDSNGITCKSVLLEDNFLLVADHNQRNIFQVDIRNGEVRAVCVTPTDFLQITAMDYDPFNKTVYAFHSVDYLIVKVAFVDRIPSTVRTTQGQVISSLVVDAVGQMLYYVNYDLGTIMRTSLSGDDPSTIVSGKGTLARAIALDVQNRLMFWSDCGHYSIDQAPISNPSSHHSVVTVSGLCATAIAIDFSNQLIFWADDTGRIEQVAYSGAGRLLIRQLSSTSSITGLAVDSNYVYISDSKQRQIQRINRSTPTYEISNLTSARFSSAYTITLFSSAIWNNTKDPSLRTSSTTPAFRSTNASAGTSITTNTSTSASGSTTASKDSVSLTTIIVASIVSGAVVLVVVIVTVGIVISKKCRRKPSEQQNGAYDTTIDTTIVYDTINYSNVQNGATHVKPEVEHQYDNAQVQDNRPDRRSDPTNGLYELDPMLRMQLYSQLTSQGSQRSTDKKPSDPPSTIEPIENDYL